MHPYRGPPASKILCFLRTPSSLLPSLDHGSPTAPGEQVQLGNRGQAQDRVKRGGGHRGTQPHGLCL